MNRHFKLSNYEYIVRRHNPFGFIGPNGQPYDFSTYNEAYFHCLIKLFEMFPRGYIDLPLFIHQQMQLNLPDAVRFVKTLNPMGIKGEIQLLPIWAKSKQRDDMLEVLFRAFHTITESTFVKSSFLSALDDFDGQYIDLKDRISRGISPIIYQNK